MASLKKATTLITILTTTLFLTGKAIPPLDICHGIKKENECNKREYCAWTSAKPPKKGVCDTNVTLNSRESILKFQKEHGLELSGERDKETLKKIDELKNLKIK